MGTIGATSAAQSTASKLTGAGPASAGDARTATGQATIDAMLPGAAPAPDGLPSLEMHSTGCTTSLDGPVELYPMPESGAQPLIDGIRRADKYVDVSSYLLNHPGIVEALKAEAAEGTEVRVMLEPNVVGEAPSNAPSIEDQLADLRAAGILAKVTPERYDLAGAVDHAKMLVIDRGEETWIGSGNLVRGGLGSARKNNRDFWLRDARPQAACEASVLFDHDWERQETADLDFHSLVVSPHDAEKRVTEFIDGAEHKLLVYNQDVRNKRLIARLIAAKTERGVDVQVITAPPKRNGDDMSAETIRRLQAAGIPVIRQQAPYVHAKGMVADDERLFIGSQNFSYAAFGRNRDVGDVVTNREAASRFTSVFEADQARARLVEEEVPAPPPVVP